jgi:hypothetical protein
VTDLDPTTLRDAHDAQPRRYGGAMTGMEVERQRAHFAARGQEVEWKLHGHDRPADIAHRLWAHGFAPEEQEGLRRQPPDPRTPGPAGGRDDDAVRFRP